MSFDNFAALESYLKAIKVSYEEATRKYEEILGGILRDSKTGASSKKMQDRWIYEIQQSLAAKDPKAHQQLLKKESSKDKQALGTGEWVMLDPLSVFVGMKSRGIAELYFDVISELREILSKISLAISVVTKLKLKASTMGNSSLIVSFANDIPNKIVLKTNKQAIEKYSVVYNFAIASAVPAAKSMLAN
jgi:hypothetical protein